MKMLNVEDNIVFYLDHKFKVNSLEVNNPGKSIPFSRLPKKSLDSKPLKISTVFGEPFDFIGNNLKPLWELQPFGQGKACKIQGIISGQVTGNAGNIQNICSKYGVLIPPKKTIRFDGLFGQYQKPFKNYHIKTAYQSDVLIIPFLFTFISHITCIQILQNVLTIFHRRVYSRFDQSLTMTHENKPLTFDMLIIISNNDHIQMTSLNEVSGYTDNNHSLIYGIEIYAKNIKNKHREAMTINDYSSMTSINKMHNFYAYFLIVSVYISYLVYIIYCIYGFISLIRQRGSRGDLSPLDVHIHI